LTTTLIKGALAFVCFSFFLVTCAR